MPKNIVVFSDGTGQEGGLGNSTNIYKLFNMIEDRTADQISFYDRGLGTGWRKVTGKIAGMGISKNILECYDFIFEQFNAGDHIYLFGFSRGATTVRSLSGFIHMFGILPKSRPELIKMAYRIYKIRNPDKRNKLASKFVKQNHTMWCKIKYLGVWDTVAALGIPFKTIDVVVDRIPFFRHKFHDLAVSKSVINARHALAIDDERLTFHPTLWNESHDPDQTMKQVWFCGMHTDVGGGYKEQELSDIPLMWVVAEAAQFGLRIYSNHKIVLNPSSDGLMHDSRAGIPGRLYRQRIRQWEYSQRGKPTIHESVTMRADSVNGYDPWILKKAFNIEEWPECLRGGGRLICENGSCVLVK